MVGHVEQRARRLRADEFEQAERELSVVGVEALAHLVGDEQPRPRGERGTEQRELLLALREIGVWAVEQVGAVEA